MSDWFERRHPLVGAAAFGIPIIVTCFLTEWYLSAASLALAVFFAFILAGGDVMRRRLPGIAILMILVALSNPFIVHTGSRILFFVNGVPITLEAVEYGLNLGLMIAAVIVWCICWDRVMTEQKIYRLTRWMHPGAALVLSMSLRLVPLYMRRWDDMRKAREFSGSAGSGGIISKCRDAVTCFSGLMTWAIENSRTTAVSMVSRGACLTEKKRRQTV